MADTHPPLLTRRRLLGVAQEVTSGTYVDPSGAMADTVVYDARMEVDDLYSDGERQPHGHYFGSVDAVRGPQTGKLTFRTELTHSDAFMTLVAGCGFGVASTTATVNSDISTHKTLSLALWMDGLKKMLSGAAGTFTIEPAGVGQRVFVNWEFSGVFLDPVDEAMPARADVQDKGYLARSMTLTLGGSAIPHVSTFTLDAGSEVEARQALTSPEGVSHYVVTDVNPKLTIDPEARLVAQHDAYGILTAATTQALSLILADAAGNTFTIAAPRAQRTGVNDADRDRKTIDNVELMLRNQTGDDAVSLAKADAP